MRPPTPGSRTTVVAGSPDAECPLGHHVDSRVVHTSKACSAEQSIGKLSRRGSIIGSTPLALAGVLSDEAKAGHRLAPHLRQVVVHRLHTLVVEGVDAPGAD